MYPVASTYGCGIDVDAGEGMSEVAPRRYEECPRRLRKAGVADDLKKSDTEPSAGRISPEHDVLRGDCCMKRAGRWSNEV